MVLKALFLAILIYYIFKTVRRLVRAVYGDGMPSQLHEQRDRAPNWDRRPAERTPIAEDIEDAKYVDI